MPALGTDDVAGRVDVETPQGKFVGTSDLFNGRPLPSAMRLCELSGVVLRNERAPRPARPLLRRSLKAIQRWNYRQAHRGTRYVATSRLSRQRIRAYWGGAWSTA